MRDLRFGAAPRGPGARAGAAPHRISRHAGEYHPARGSRGRAAAACRGIAPGARVEGRRRTVPPGRPGNSTRRAGRVGPGRRGFSLFELVVALALGLVILRVLAAVVMPLSREVRRSLAEVELTNQCLALEANWGRDLSRSRAAERSFSAQAGPWLLRPLADRLSAGQAVLAPELVAYRLAEGRLTRLEVAVAGPGLPAPGEVSARLAAPRASRLLATGVTRCVCEAGAGGEVTVTVELVREVAGRTVQRHWQRRWAGRNR